MRACTEIDRFQITDFESHPRTVGASTMKFSVTAAMLIVLFACGGGGDGALSTSGAAPQTNTAPVANGGTDQIVLQGAEVTLDAGSSSDADGDALTYRWSLTSKPDASGSSLDATTRTATFIADATGSYQISLIVNDATVDSAADTVLVEAITRNLLADGTAEGMWPSYAGNLSSNKYSPLSQINKDNLDNLRVAWRWRSPDNDIAGPQNAVFESTPLMIDGVLYTSTSFSQVAAINAETGATLWTYDSGAYNFGTPPNNGFLHRGLAYSEQGGRKRLYIATGDARLIALNPVNGEPISEFGSLGNGVVDLLDEVPRLNANAMSLDNAHDLPGIPNLGGVQIQYGNTSPPIVCRNVLIVGSSIHDGEVIPPSPPGDVRGFDIDTGELLWTFHTIPRDGELGVSTWQNESWRDNGGANVWAPMSADEGLGHVYLPVSCPTNNYYGGRRPGDNLFANSIVSLDCTTGELNWYYQTVHHDIWDYDLPAAPNLVDITVDGESIKALAQVSKQGFVYVLDRTSGEPVWPIIETPVAGSTVPGETTSPTQPMPVKPPPFERQGVVRSELIDPASADDYDIGPLFTPPSTRGTLLTPGIGGGANWGGASFDPATQTLYVSSLGPLTFLIRLESGGQENFYFARPQVFAGPETTSPYPGFGSSITAYDLNDGTIRWQVASTPNQIIGIGSSLVTETLLFSTNRSLSTLRMFDKENGALLGSMQVGGNITGAPMTYLLNERQYVVMALGQGDQTTELVAVTLRQ